MALPKTPPSEFVARCKMMGVDASESWRLLRLWDATGKETKPPADVAAKAKKAGLDPKDVWRRVKKEIDRRWGGRKPPGWVDLKKPLRLLIGGVLVYLLLKD